ncbi:Nuclear pore complex protein Nup160-like protein, partial [Gryllus bimaculatus]
AAAAPRDAARTLLEQLGAGGGGGGVGGGDSDALSPSAQYTLLLVRLFSLGRHWDCVLALAEAGAARAINDEERATLHLLAFGAHLRLGRLARAFHALVAIPDRQRARLCLRQLVLSRARAQPPGAGPHYSFLYALHMGRGAARKAAFAMLEQALRARAELPASAANVRLRARCLLACLNALRLAAPDVRWLVRPDPEPARAHDHDHGHPRGRAAPDNGEDDASDEGLSGEAGPRSALARRRPADAEVLALATHRRVALLTLEDVEREYLLASAHLALLRRDQHGFGAVAGDLSPAEIVTACTSAGLYETALLVGQRCGLPLDPVVRHLACTCIDLTRRGMQNAEETWVWLKENDVWEFGIGDAAALELAWKLLEVQLSRLEPLPAEEGSPGAGPQCSEGQLPWRRRRRWCRGAFCTCWLVRASGAADAARLLAPAGRPGRLEEPRRCRRPAVTALAALTVAGAPPRRRRRCPAAPSPPRWCRAPRSACPCTPSTASCSSSRPPRRPSRRPMPSFMLVIKFLLLCMPALSLSFLSVQSHPTLKLAIRTMLVVPILGVVLVLTVASLRPAEQRQVWVPVKLDLLTKF